MVDRFLMSIVFTLCICNTYAQSGKDNPFPRVIVPDSIAVQLREAYKSTTELRCNAEANVYNLIDRFNYDFKDGIYSFRGMGPHSPEEYLYLIRVNCIFLEMKDSLLRKVLYGNLQRLWTL